MSLDFSLLVKKCSFNPGVFINIDLFREMCGEKNSGQTIVRFLVGGNRINRR